MICYPFRRLAHDVTNKNVQSKERDWNKNIYFDPVNELHAHVAENHEKSELKSKNAEDWIIWFDCACFCRSRKLKHTCKAGLIRVFFIFILIF